MMDTVAPWMDREHNLDSFCAHIAKDSGLRVTLINSKGKVLGESETDKSIMENHYNREEIRALREGAVGQSIRYSKTLKIDFLYVAKPYKYQNETIYFRLATPLRTVMGAFYTLLIQLIVAVVVMLGISYYIAHQLNRRVIHDVKELKNYFKEISLNKNYEAIVHIKYIHEFLELSLILKNAIKRLQKKDKKK